MARDQEPVRGDRGWSLSTVVVALGLVFIAGFSIAESAAHDPVVVPVDAALTLVALVVGAVTWRGSARRAVVRVLGFAAAPPVVFACTWIWFAGGVTVVGETYGDTVMSVFLYVCGFIGLIVMLTAGNLIADTATRGSARTVARRVRRVAQTSLALLVIVTLLGTHAALRRPAYERWLTSLPLRADFGPPATWPTEAWSTIASPGSRGATHYRELRVDGQHLRVYRHGNQINVCWPGVSGREGTDEGASNYHRCTRPDFVLEQAVRVRRDDARGLWVVDLGNRYSSGAFTDRGARVGPTYARILWSAAPPASWVVSAWVALLLAVALLRWPRRSGGPSASATTPYRPLPIATEVADPAMLRGAFAVTICAVHAAPLAAYFLRAALG